MQTPAERSLISHLAQVITSKKDSSMITQMINLGASKSVVIESYLLEQGLQFVCDRLDVEDCEIQAPYVEHCYQASLSDMNEVSSDHYDLAFSNYVLEHVTDLAGCASEIHRILKTKGKYVVSTPNPSAPEFLLSKITPLAFHQWIRGSKTEHRAFETVYAYKNLKKLIEVFAVAGLRMEKSEYFPATYTYLYRFPVLRTVSKWYDSIVAASGIKSLQGNVCLVFIKD